MNIQASGVLGTRDDMSSQFAIPLSTNTPHLGIKDKGRNPPGKILFTRGETSERFRQ